MIAHSALDAPASAGWLWPPDTVVTLVLAALGIAYAVGVRRAPGTTPAWRRGSFALGLGVAWLALASRLDAYAGALFSAHMVQHLLLMMAAVPLLLLGAPVRLARHALPPAGRRALAGALRSRPARALLHPAVGWVAWGGVLWVSHFTGLYQATLEDPAIHHLEHAAYIGAAFLFWSPVVASEPTRRLVPVPLRLLVLFLATPQTALLGAAILAADAPLYPHYERAPAWAGPPLQDQQLAGVLMWIVGGFGMLAATIATAGAWSRRERGIEDRAPVFVDEAPALVSARARSRRA